MQITPGALRWFTTSFDAIVENIERVIQGKRRTIELVTIALVSEGHALIEDVPGVGKTLLAKSLARSIDCSFRRIQFTPDLLPSDVTGASVWARESGDFVFRPGPVFGNVVLGDEINRAGPKTQAALLEAMEERQVTVDGVTRLLDPPFIVIATQNPVEHEGTYPLPEAQLDRFMMRLTVGYPSRAKELEMLERHGEHSRFAKLGPVVHADDIVAMAELARRVHVSDAVRGYLIDLVEATRRSPHLLLGASPRASLYLQRAARTSALVAGRDYVVPDDVKAMLEPVLNHRLVLGAEARLEGVTVQAVLGDVVAAVPVPGTRIPA